MGLLFNLYAEQSPSIAPSKPTEHQLQQVKMNANFALVLMTCVLAGSAVRADDMQCNDIGEEGMKYIMDSCPAGECNFECMDSIEDALEDYGPKVDCTMDKFTDEYIKHEAEECLDMLHKSLMEEMEDFPCSKDEVMEVAGMNIDELKELVCDGADDDDDDDDDEDGDDDDDDDEDGSDTA